MFYAAASRCITKMNKTFLILGGYGNTGKIIAELLLKETNLNLILAGRIKYVS